MLILLKNSRGFTLIEILVAMFLIAFVVGVVATGSFSTAEDLEESVNNVERAVRFSVDEAALRNSIVRVRFYLDKSPQQYSVEYGPDDSLVIPLSVLEPDKGEVGREAEAQDKKRKKFDKEFNRIQEFSSGPKELNNNVRIIGVGSSLSKTMIQDGQASLYTYPTGEKDSGLVILATETEVVGISVDAFSDLYNQVRKEISEEVLYEEIADEQEKLAKEMFDEWLSKK